MYPKTTCIRGERYTFYAMGDKCNIKTTPYNQATGTETHLSFPNTQKKQEPELYSLISFKQDALFEICPYIPKSHSTCSY